MPPCKLCRIGRGDCPADYRVEMLYEQHYTVAFRPVDNMLADEHIIIMPRKHVMTFDMMLTEERGRLWGSFVWTQKLLREKLRIRDHRLIVNIGKLATGGCRHFHVHLLVKKEWRADAP